MNKKLKYIIIINLVIFLLFLTFLTNLATSDKYQEKSTFMGKVVNQIRDNAKKNHKIQYKNSEESEKEYQEKLQKIALLSVPIFIFMMRYFRKSKNKNRDD